MKYLQLILVNLLFLTAKSQDFQLEKQYVDDIRKNMDSYSQHFIPSYSRYEYPIDIGESELYKYPNENIQLFYVENKIKKSFSHMHSEPYDYLLSKRILIGFDKKANSIIYISGDILKNNIANEFNLDVEKPETFNRFLELKLYNFWITNIRFKESTETYLLFQARSNTVKDDVLIKVNRLDFDLLQVKTLKFNWTEKGTYTWLEDKN